MSDNLWPVTIIRSRYQGVYEGADWLAFNLEVIPPEVQGSDPECRTFFAETTLTIGRGDTPDEALADLRRVLSE